MSTSRVRVLAIKRFGISVVWFEKYTYTHSTSSSPMTAQELNTGSLITLTPSVVAHTLFLRHLVRTE